MAAAHEQDPKPKKKTTKKTGSRAAATSARKKPPAKKKTTKSAASKAAEAVESPAPIEAGVISAVDVEPIGEVAAAVEPQAPHGFEIPDWSEEPPVAEAPKAPPPAKPAPRPQTRRNAARPVRGEDDTDFLAGLWGDEAASRPAPAVEPAPPAPIERWEAVPIPPVEVEPPLERALEAAALDEAPLALSPESAKLEMPAGPDDEPLSAEAPNGDLQNGEQQNGERRRRRRRGRRGRGRGRGQDGNGQPNGQTNDQPGGQPVIAGQAGTGLADRPPRDQREPRDQHGRQDHSGRERRDQHRPQQDQRDRRDQGDQRNQPDQRGRGDQRDQHRRGDHRDARQAREDRGGRDAHHDRGSRGPQSPRESAAAELQGPHKPEPKQTPQLTTQEDGDEALALQGNGERTMLINVAEGEECRIAILHQGRLEELFMERASTGSHVGNIYKGRVTNVEPSIQAAFIDFGLPKNGFLHISDLQPQYFPDGMRQTEEVGRKTPRRERPPIQRCLRRGQEVLVQIIKEGIGTKGPTLTTYISIPGRYLVMLPGMNRVGVSRKIEDEDLRRKMRRILDELELPRDMGFILRTAGTESAKKELQRDLQYLQRLWKVVANRIKNERAPCELYQESDLVIRTVRDVFSADFGKIIVDDEPTAEKIRDFLSIVMPRGVAPVEAHSGPEPLFHKYHIEEEIERINSRYVPLPLGGSLVVDSTEALVAIDVNSGRYRDLEDAEETAYRINIEAAEEIARQLRLRDLGGLIVCDFIDMRMEKHRRAVERSLRDALKKHKERAKCLRMSQFGIIEMTRQRMRPSIKRSIYQDCPHCRGAGLVKNAESMTLDIMRLLRLTVHKEGVQSVEVRVSTSVAHQLLNRKRGAIVAMEQVAGRRIVVRSDANFGLDQYLFECLDARGGVIATLEPPADVKPGSDNRSKRNTSPVADVRELRESFEDAFD